MLFETPAADPDAVNRWRNRALRFALPSNSNAPDVVRKPAAGNQSEGEDVRQFKKRPAACYACLSHKAYTAACCSCCSHHAMLFFHEQIFYPTGGTAVLAVDANVWCRPLQCSMR